VLLDNFLSVREVDLLRDFVPHRSGPNISDGSRRVIYLTFNLADE